MGCQSSPNATLHLPLNYPQNLESKNVILESSGSEVEVATTPISEKPPSSDVNTKSTFETTEAGRKEGSSCNDSDFKHSLVADGTLKPYSSYLLHRARTANVKPLVDFSEEDLEEGQETFDSRNDQPIINDSGPDLRLDPESDETVKLEVLLTEATTKNLERSVIVIALSD